MTMPRCGSNRMRLFGSEPITKEMVLRLEHQLVVERLDAIAMEAERLYHDQAAFQPRR